MRRLALVACLATLPAASLALTPLVDIAPLIQDRDWQLLAVDGQPLAPGVVASLLIASDGQVSGQAPCNSFSTQNRAVLPEIALGPIMATKMACDQLAAEVDFFDALGRMQVASLDGKDNLILTGADGRSMEFVLDRTNAAITCKTCVAG